MSREQRFLRLRYSILRSSLLLEDPATRWLFLTMLLLGDDAGTGIIDMPIEILAPQAGLTVEQARSSLERLMAPDPNSRCELEEGRRIVPLPREPGMAPRGWRLVNWDAIKADAEREATLLRVTRHRQKKRPVTPSNAESQKVTPDSDSDSDSDSSPSTPSSKKRKLRERPQSMAEHPELRPTVEQAEALIAERYPEFGGQDLGSVFVAYYEEAGWVKLNDKDIFNWKATLYRWIADRRAGKR